MQRQDVIDRFPSVVEGTLVRSRDGHKLGRIAVLGDADFTIESGDFFTPDFRAPYDAIADVRSDEVVLRQEGRELTAAFRS